MRVAVRGYTVDQSVEISEIGYEPITISRVARDHGWTDGREHHRVSNGVHLATVLHNAGSTGCSEQRFVTKSQDVCGLLVFNFRHQIWCTCLHVCLVWVHRSE